MKTNRKRSGWAVAIGALATVGAIGCGEAPADPDGGALADACAACGDAGGGDRDGGRDDDGGHAGDDGGPLDSGAGDAGTRLPTEPVVLALSPAGHDRVYAVVHDAAGNLYATGQIAGSIESGADFELFVAKLDATGVLDEGFGDAGVARVNVAVGGTSREVARGIVVQSSGRIVIGATAEHDPSATGLAANDTDIVLVGFEPDGDLDPTFGDAGIDRIDLGTGVVTTNSMGVDVLSAGDAQWGLALDSMDRLVIHGATRAPDPATYAEYAVVRRLADGGADTSFGGGDGYVTLDVGMAAAGARTLDVLDDDSIVAFGYTTSSVLVRPVGDTATTSQQPVVYKLTPAGEFDATFAIADATTAPGVWHDFATPLPERRNAEAYGGAILSDGRIVTIGYGPTPIAGGTGSDLVSFRWSAAGVLDPTYGSGGLTYVDVGMQGDNGRYIVALPDDRTLSVGAGRPVPPAGGSVEQDALVLVLSADGVPDASFGEGGLRLYDLGGNDHFWGAHVHRSASGDHVAVGGIAAGEVVGTDDDDSVFLFLPL